MGIWQFYSAAKKHLMDGSIDLDADAFRMALYASASNAGSLTLSTIGSVTNEASGLGYSSGGKPLTGTTWGTGASAREMRFNANPLLWAGPINAVKFAVISKDGTSAAARKLLCVVQLSTSQFNVGAGVPLTIAPPPRHRHLRIELKC